MTNYTAINTKVRAMKGSLVLTPEEIDDRLAGYTLSDLYQALDQLPSYHQVMPSEQNKLDLTAENLIDLIDRGLRYDFLKLYRFSGFEQRAALSVYGIRFEREFITKVLRGLERQESVPFVVNPFTDYLEKHRHFHIGELITKTSVLDAIDTFRDTDYGKFFEDYHDYFHDHDYNHYIISTVFEQYCADLVWKKASRVLNDKALTRFKKLFGSEMDLANIRTIFRLKFYYEVDENFIRSQLFSPGRYLNEANISALLASQDKNSFFNLLTNLGYQDLFKSGENKVVGLKQQKAWLKTIEHRFAKSLPQSVLPLFDYLSLKELEADLLKEKVEAIAYQSPVTMPFHNWKEFLGWLQKWVWSTYLVPVMISTGWLTNT